MLHITLLTRRAVTVASYVLPTLLFIGAFYAGRAAENPEALSGWQEWAALAACVFGWKFCRDLIDDLPRDGEQ